jgi:hypothetical protein
MFETIANLIGLRIDDEKIIAFMEKNGFKYPKKPTISNRSTDTSYWIENKKLGIDLLFDARNYLVNYPLIPGERKGIFIPVLKMARWYNNKSKTVFPHNLDFDHRFDEITAKLGAPTIKSSEIAPTWLNDDGSESFYRWKIPVLEEKDVFLTLEYRDDDSIDDFRLGLKHVMPIFLFYSNWVYQDYDDLVKMKDFHTRADLHFLRWSIENDLVRTDESTAATIQSIKEGKVLAREFIKVLNRGYLEEDDFSSEGRFVRQYIQNLSGHDILYTRDVAFLFLETAEQRQNYLGAAAISVLNEVPDNEETYQTIRSLLDRRLAEYRAHQFKQSKQLQGS